MGLRNKTFESNGQLGNPGWYWIDVEFNGSDEIEYGEFSWKLCISHDELPEGCLEVISWGSLSLLTALKPLLSANSLDKDVS